VFRFMARDQYRRDLEALKDSVVELGSLASQAILDSVASLKNRDVELAQQVIDQDDKVDSFCFSIEDSCLRLLALQQPMARDLRMICAVLRMIVDLERIGDLALEIALITKATAEEEPVKPLVDIPRMAEICAAMVKSALEAFKEGDEAKAREVARRDDEVDALFDQIRRELITYMVEDPRKIRGAQHLTFVARYLERIGDHANNVCESIVYMVTGERVELN